MDNGYNILNFEIKIVIINDPPYFKDGGPTDIYALINEETTFTLTTIEDKENLPVSIITYSLASTQLPRFV